jgi:hypothetical protein
VVNYIEWLENSSWAIAIRQSIWLYPALEIVHILGIVMLVGAAFIFDLRLLGYFRHISVFHASRFLLPVSRKGLWLIIPSGLLLFITNASSLAYDKTFWVKIGLLFVAALNVWVFHKWIVPASFDGKDSEELPQASIISAFLSIVCWITIIACGRLLAY